MIVARSPRTGFHAPADLPSFRNNEINILNPRRTLLLLRSRIVSITILLAIPLLQGLEKIRAEEARKLTWGFESDEPGEIARGFTAEVGTWEVAEQSSNKVLAQKASNPDDSFNVAMVDDGRFKDVDISVRLKAVAGEVDQGVS